jgi:hypothetical protein
MKKTYIKPTMQVVELQHKCSILGCSDFQSTRGPLNYRGSDEFYDEEDAR